MKGQGLQLQPVGDGTYSLVTGPGGTLSVGDTTYQCEALILQSHKGEWKEYPTLGVGIADMLCDNDIDVWRREIALQLAADDMKVSSIEIDTVNHKLTINAHYYSA